MDIFGSPAGSKRSVDTPHLRVYHTVSQIAVPRLPVIVPVQSGEPQSLPEVYGSYSSGDIILTMDGGPLAQPQDLDFESVGEGILQSFEWFDEETKNPGDQPVRRWGFFTRIGCAKCPRGLDSCLIRHFAELTHLSSTGPVKVVRYSLDAITALRSGDDYFKQLGFTAAHELGHVFNFCATWIQILLSEYQQAGQRAKQRCLPLPQ